MSSRHRVSSSATAAACALRSATRAAAGRPPRDRARRSPPPAGGTPPAPTPAARVARALTQRSRQRQQVLHVRTCVGKLLVGQRPPVPARERGRLRHGRAQELPEQRLVARLDARSHEGRGDLGVEQVPGLHAPDRFTSGMSCRPACTTTSIPGSASTGPTGPGPSPSSASTTTISGPSSPSTTSCTRHSSAR